MLPLLLQRLNNACGEKKEKEIKEGFMWIRGRDKAFKLKQIYSQSGMEINKILLTGKPPGEIGEA